MGFLRAIFGGVEAAEAQSLSARLDHVDTRLERLELDNAQRQVAVLTTLEKVLHQLRAREVKRQRDAEEQAPVADGEEQRAVRMVPRSIRGF